MTQTTQEQWGQILELLEPGTSPKLWARAEKLAQARGRWAVDQFERAYAAAMAKVTGKKTLAIRNHGNNNEQRHARALEVMAVMPLGEWVTTAQVRDLAGLRHSTQAGNFLAALAGAGHIERDRTNRNHFMWRRPA